MNDGVLKNIIQLIEKNQIIKASETETINKLKKLYELISKYKEPEYSFEDMIHNPGTRLNFLSSSIEILLNEDYISDDIRELGLNMFDSLYSYFTENSKLEDVVIPRTMKDKMFIEGGIKKESLLIPTSNEMYFLFLMMLENKRIYSSEFKGKDLSIKITQGLHKNITELMEIKEENLSHLLGTNNKAHSLYEFYRKNIIDEQNKNLGKPGTEAFESGIEKKYGITYQELLEYEYKETDLIKKLEDGILTEEQANNLRESYFSAPKGRAIDFYASKEGFIKLIEENNRCSDFIYQYMRDKIVEEKLKNKQQRKSLLNSLPYESQEEKEEFSKKMLDQKNYKTNSKEIKKYINDYFIVYSANLKNDESYSGFREEFKKRFKYDYPLIDYYESIIKNVSFYNFSLMRNLNSLIVDFQYIPNKYFEPDFNFERDNADTFLVSYSEAKKNNQIRLYREKVNQENETVQSEEYDITDDYIAALKSLYMFPSEDRYYFEQTFKPLQAGRLNLIKDDNLNYYMMGFCTSVEEKAKLEDLNLEIDDSIIRSHRCITNRTESFREYVGKYTRLGQEYAIGVIEESPAIGSGTNEKSETNKFPGGNGPQPKKIICINDVGPNGLLRYIEMFNDYRIGIKNGNFRNKEYEKRLIDSINGIVDGYKRLIETRIKVLDYKKALYSFNKNDIENYDYLINKEIIALDKFEKYYEKTKYYFKEYENIFEESMTEIQSKQEQSSKKKR